MIWKSQFSSDDNEVVNVQKCTNRELHSEYEKASPARAGVDFPIGRAHLTFGLGYGTIFLLAWMPMYIDL